MGHCRFRSVVYEGWVVIGGWEVGSWMKSGRRSEDMKSGMYR